MRYGINIFLFLSSGRALNIESEYRKMCQKFQIVRRRIISKGLRLDGRGLDEVRPVFCESGSLPQLHGSSIFSRGDTQVSIISDSFSLQNSVFSMPMHKHI